MTKWQSTLIMALTIACTISPVLAVDRNTATSYRHTGSTINEEKAIRIVKMHIKGRVLAINLFDQIYRIKVLDHQGSMHIVQVNALDGAIISIH